MSGIFDGSFYTRAELAPARVGEVSGRPADPQAAWPADTARCSEESDARENGYHRVMRTFGMAVGLGLTLFLVFAFVMPVPPIEPSPVGR